MSHTSSSGHCSQVKLWLRFDGREIGLSKIAERQIVLETPELLSQGNGVVVMEIDQHVRMWDVELIYGAVPYDRVVEIVDR